VSKIEQQLKFNRRSKSPRPVGWLWMPTNKKIYNSRHHKQK